MKFEKNGTCVTTCTVNLDEDQVQKAQSFDQNLRNDMIKDTTSFNMLGTNGINKQVQDLSLFEKPKRKPIGKPQIRVHSKPTTKGKSPFTVGVIKMLLKNGQFRSFPIFFPKDPPGFYKPLSTSKKVQRKRKSRRKRK